MPEKVRHKAKAESPVIKASTLDVWHPIKQTSFYKRDSVLDDDGGLG